MNADKQIIEVITDYFKITKQKQVKQLLLNRPKSKEHGDFSSNIAMIMAKDCNQNPRELAQELVDKVKWPAAIEKVEIAGPGFLNFFIKESLIYQTLLEIDKQQERFGTNKLGQEQKTLIEFVSANPTGPLTVGHGRNAVLGDTFARILEANGYLVDREYYFNNAGRQMRVLGESVYHRYMQLIDTNHPFPEDHYQGDYIKDIAKQIYDKNKDSLAGKITDNLFKQSAEQAIFEDIKGTLERLKIHHDTFQNEDDFYSSGKIKAILDEFKRRDLSYEKDGATWLRTSQLGMEDDRVIVKESGEPTYRLPDIAYHKDKFDRGYDKIIDIFGADHIDSYPDVLAAIKELGYDIDKVKVIIYQFVTLLRHGEIVKMSTRAANYVTLDELIDEVGADVVRYFINMRSVNTHLNFDLDLAKKQSDENPVFYLQYAHARISSILRRSNEKKLSASDKHLDQLNTEFELDLIKKCAEYPELIAKIGENLEQHKLCTYLYDLATSYHRFNTNCFVLDEENVDLSEARLFLISCVKTVLANGFYILGIEAKERM